MVTAVSSAIKAIPLVEVPDQRVCNQMCPDSLIMERIS